MDNPVHAPTHFAHGMGPHAAETFDKYHRFVLDQLESQEFAVYVTCFCESGDLLSQWRAYGADHGYAIEFSGVDLREAVNKVTRAYGSGLFQVGYGEDAAAEAARNAVEDVSQFNLNHPGVKAE
jgi:hypothetical protein